MEDAQIGWIAAIVIGGVAGWLAKQFMKSDMGILMNIVLGIVGAAIASTIFGYFGIVLGGWMGLLSAPATELQGVHRRQAWIKTERCSPRRPSTLTGPGRRRRAVRRRSGRENPGPLQKNNSSRAVPVV